MKTVLFVGGFSNPSDGTQGGQLFACQSLVASPLSGFLNWILVDSTQRSNPAPHLGIRCLDAIKRVLRLSWHLCFSRVDVVLIFSSLMGVSIYEKGVMCMLGRVFGKQVILSTRSHPELPTRFPQLFRRFVRLSCRATDAIVCQSELGKKNITDLFDVSPATVHVIPNWIDTRQFYLKDKSQNRDVSDAPLTVAYVGWLDPVKGLNYLFDAIRLLSLKRTDFRVRLYGGGVSEDELKSHAANSGIEQLVEFMGWIPQSEVRDALNSADIFVFPTLFEGMPNSVLQAMACGLPIISSDVTCIPEIVEDQHNGILVPPRCPQAICDAISELLDNADKRQTMGLRNANRITACHSIDVAWRRMAKLLGIDSVADDPLPRKLQAECAE